MRVAHILNNFLPDQIAGTEIYALNLGKELNAKNHEVVFIIPNYGSHERIEYIIEGMRVIKYAEPSVVDKSLQMGKRQPDGLKAFGEVLQRELPDIVHFHELAGSNGIGLGHILMAKKYSFKVLMTFHLARYTTTDVSGAHLTNVFDNRTGTMDFYVKRGMGKFSSHLLYALGSFCKFIGVNTSRWGTIGTALAMPSLVEKQKKDFESLVENVDAVVTVARWYRDELIDVGVSPEKLHFIEQGIEFGDTVMHLNCENRKDLKVVFVGRISHFKGTKEIINTIKNMSGLSLDIYGDSGENKEYIMECRELAAGLDHIFMKGALQPKHVIQTISKYDLFLLPSTVHEMSPLVIREAFAAGVPVLASDSRGVQEQITEGQNGWFFKMNDWEDLKEKLTWLVQHPEKIEEAGHFPPVRTFHDVAAEYEVLYEELI